MLTEAVIADDITAEGGAFERSATAGDHRLCMVGQYCVPLAFRRTLASGSVRVSASEVGDLRA